MRFVLSKVDESWILRSLEPIPDQARDGVDIQIFTRDGVCRTFDSGREPVVDGDIDIDRYREVLLNRVAGCVGCGHREVIRS